MEDKSIKDINKILKKYDYLTMEIAKRHGISKFKFYKYLNENNYEKISRGVYALPNELVDELYLIHKKIPKAIFSHDEAFYFHGLSDREPIKNTITVYSGYNIHRLKNLENLKVYMIKKELLEVGKIIVKDNFGNKIPIYDLERTICDLIRNRSSIEIQDFNSVLKSYVKRKDKDLNKLIEYAKLFRVEKIIRKYLEILL